MDRSPVSSCTSISSLTDSPIECPRHTLAPSRPVSTSPRFSIRKPIRLPCSQGPERSPSVHYVKPARASAGSIENVNSWEIQSAIQGRPSTSSSPCPDSRTASPAVMAAGTKKTTSTIEIATPLEAPTRPTASRTISQHLPTLSILEARLPSKPQLPAPVQYKRATIHRPTVPRWIRNLRLALRLISLALAAIALMLATHSLGLYRQRSQPDYSLRSAQLATAWPTDLNLVSTYLLMVVAFVHFDLAVIETVFSLRRPFRGWEDRWSMAWFRFLVRVVAIVGWAAAVAVWRVLKDVGGGGRGSLVGWAGREKGAAGDEDVDRVWMEQCAAAYAGLTAAGFEVLVLVSLMVQARRSKR